MSFRRQGVLLMKYWPSPERKTRRVTVISWYSVPSTFSQSENVRLTSAMPMGLRMSVPLNMKSSCFVPRSILVLCSPKTQQTESNMLLLPHPFGPTIAVMPGAKSRWV